MYFHLDYWSGQMNTLLMVHAGCQQCDGASFWLRLLLVTSFLVHVIQIFVQKEATS